MEPPGMAASTETSPGTTRPWSRLPDDLLSIVLARLDSSRDLARFAMVCTSWRAALLTRPPRHIHPMLLLDLHGGGETKRAYCPGDGAILPLVSLLGETRGKCFVGSHPGGWVAYGAPLRVTNIFSGAEVALPPEDQGRGVAKRKVVFSESPASSGCILAAITDKHEVVICWLGIPENGWTTGRYIYNPVTDIAFCKGHLYCIVENMKAIAKLEVGLDKYGVPLMGAVQWPSILDNNYVWSGAEYSRYIVELRGKVVMAVRGPWGPRGQLRRNRGPYFLLFELVDVIMDRGTTQDLYSWENVTTLGNHALFLGPSCSKAMHVPTSRHAGLRRNHIYYSHHRCYARKKRVLEEAEVFFASSNERRVYYKMDEITDYVDHFTSVGYYVVGGAHPPMWLFPPHM